METTKTYENFPARTIILSNSVSVLIYISGLIITLRLGWIFAVLYLAFVLALEYRVISRHCVNCYYWGKNCGFGKGRLSSLFFRKGDPSKFCEKQMSWKDMIPDLLVTLIPVVAGIVLLIVSFNILVLAAMLLMILLTTAGNGFIRGKLTCASCRQRELGCPAEKLFSKQNQNN